MTFTAELSVLVLFILLFSVVLSKRYGKEFLLFISSTISIAVLLLWILAYNTTDPATVRSYEAPRSEIQVAKTDSRAMVQWRDMSRTVDEVYLYNNIEDSTRVRVSVDSVFNHYGFLLRTRLSIKRR
jgi:hypothetical protein